MIRLLALPIAGTLAVLAIPASPSAAASVRVAYADLDLASDAGRAALDRRLNAAVNRVCPVEQPADLSARMACRRETMASARAQLPRPSRHAVIAALR